MQEIKELAKKLYKNENGDPFDLTDGQAEIFSLVSGMTDKYAQIITYTQYGKSDVVAMGALTRVSSIPEKIVIVAPTHAKAGIIMGYCIDHIFDNEYTIGKFRIEKGDSLERIRRERNRTHLTFKCKNGIGGIATISAEGRRTKDVIGAALGFGAKRVIIDESPMLSEQHYAGIFRMVGGRKEHSLIEIGNAINRGHFYITSRDPEYRHIVIDYLQGIKEGRQSLEYFEKARKTMGPSLFSMLYECKFPAEDAIDQDGYMPLFTEGMLDRAYVDGIEIVGKKRMGIDVAGGGRNYSVVAVRGLNAAKIVFRGQVHDTMALLPHILNTARDEVIYPEDIFIDKVGIGMGLYNRLAEVMREKEDFMGKSVVGVNFGEKSEDPERFANLRAQAYWLASEWMNGGGKLIRNFGWEECLRVKWKYQSEKLVRIKSKEDMMREGFESPDIADALALTFSRSKPARVAPKTHIPGLREYAMANRVANR